MKGLNRQIYTKEFKEEAVKLVTEQGLTIAEAARRLSMPGQNLSRWLSKAKDGKPQESSRGKEISDKDAEISRLRRENAELRMERDILKKATAYFAKGSLPGTHS
jgi:transposase